MVDRCMVGVWNGDVQTAREGLDSLRELRTVNALLVDAAAALSVLRGARQYLNRSR